MGMSYCGRFLSTYENVGMAIDGWFGGASLLSHKKVLNLPLHSLEP